MSDKYVFIVATLVPESERVANSKIEKEIREDVEKATLAWIKEIKKVTVLNLKGNRKPTREDKDIYGRRRSFIAKVNGGKVAIPESIREDLRIKDEDLVDVEVDRVYMTKRVRKELLQLFPPNVWSTEYLTRLRYTRERSEG